MRACGIAGKREKRELGREDEDPLVAMDYGYLKLDITDEDDEDQDDKVAQNKLLMPVVTYAQTGTCAAIFFT